MTDWLLALPCWGEEYRDVFRRAVFPALLSGLTQIPDSKVRWLVHTDQPTEMGKLFDGEDVTFRPVPYGEGYWAFGQAHRDALSHARQGEAIAFLTGDLVPSVEAFAAAERRFAQGKRAVYAQAARTQVEPYMVPMSAKARDLLSWSFAHRHPYTKECFWGTGHTQTGWGIFFESDNGIVLRAFHLHPFAVVNDRVLSFQRTTVDLDLIDCFSRDEIHVVTSPDEMAFAEISPRDDKPNPLHHAIMSELSVLAWASKGERVTPMHRWLFSHRIVLTGDGSDHSDEGPANLILAVFNGIDKAA